MRKDEELVEGETLRDRQLEEVEASREGHELEMEVLKYFHPSHGQNYCMEELSKDYKNKCLKKSDR